MKRIWLAVAAGVGLAVTAQGVRADFGGPPVGPPPMMAPESYSPPVDEGARYGLHPLFRRCVWWKKDFGGCSSCGKAGKAGACGPTAGGYGMGGYGMGYPGVPGAGYPGTPGAQMPGTLVFPNHPFARGPRDYFMWEPGR